MRSSLKESGLGYHIFNQSISCITFVLEKEMNFSMSDNTAEENDF